MSDMASDIALEKLERSSRRAVLGSMAGLLIVVGSLAFAAVRLETLQREEARLLRTNVELRRANEDAESEAQRLRSQVSTLKVSISQLQCALASSRAAINAFHAREYDVAVQLYDEALKCDPQNAYLLNLKAYSLFKLGDVPAAVETAKRSVQAESTYAWGYFDLSRIYCAQTNVSEAESAARRALALRPELRAVMRADGEYRSLCRARSPFFNQLLQ